MAWRQAKGATRVYPSLEVIPRCPVFPCRPRGLKVKLRSRGASISGRPISHFVVLGVVPFREFQAGRSFRSPWLRSCCVQSSQHALDPMALSPEENSEHKANNRETGAVFCRQVRRDGVLHCRNLQYALEGVTRGVEQSRGPKALGPQPEPRMHKGDPDDGDGEAGVRVPERNVRAGQR